MHIDRNGLTHFVALRHTNQQKQELQHIPANPTNLVCWRRMDFIPEEDQAYVAFLDEVDVSHEKPKFSNITSSSKELQNTD